jgi:hypothetical protein
MKEPGIATEQRRSENSVRLPIADDNGAPLAALRLLLRAKQLEAGRLRVLLRHTRSLLDSEARAVRLGKVEAAVELLRKRTVRMEAGRGEETNARGAPGQARRYEGRAEASISRWLRRTMKRRP